MEGSTLLTVKSVTTKTEVCNFCKYCEAARVYGHRFRVKGKRTFFQSYIYSNKVLPTIVAGDKMLLFDKPRHLTHTELCLGGGYPVDYDFCGLQTQYLIGMSVPPVATANIAHEIYKQWLCHIN